MGCNESVGGLKITCIPETIKELLKRLIERRVTIVLDAEEEPERVEIEAVVGNLLVAEIRGKEDEEKEGRERRRKFKFVDIKCICAVIVDCDELLEGIFNEECNCNEEKNEVENEKDKHKKHGEEKHIKFTTSPEIDW